MASNKFLSSSSSSDDDNAYMFASSTSTPAVNDDIEPQITSTTSTSNSSHTINNPHKNNNKKITRIIHDALDTPNNDCYEFNLYMESIQQINLSGIGMWYSDTLFPKYQDFLRYCMNFIQMVSETNSYNTKKVFEIYSYIYSQTASNIRKCIDAIPETTKIYSSTPIYNFYLCCANLREYLFRRHSLDIQFFNNASNSIDYCKKYKLVVAQGNISQYNVEKLLASIRHVEYHWRVIPMTRDLYDYLDALETRSCQILTYSYDESVHNVSSMRIVVGKKKHDDEIEYEYYCSDALVFELAVRFLAIREEITGSLRERRCDPRLSKDLCDLIPTQEQCESIHRNLVIEAKKINSDDYPDHVRKEYQRMSVKPSEKYFFFKKNPTISDVEPNKVITQCRSLEAWRNICERASVQPHDMLEKASDPLGFRIALAGIVDTIFLQDTNKPWSNFSSTYDCLVKLGSVELNSMDISSDTDPYYVISVNDASVFYKRKMYVFGVGCAAQIQALGFWLNIVESKCKGITNNTRIHKVFKSITGKAMSTGNIHTNTIITDQPDMTSLLASNAVTSNINQASTSTIVSKRSEWGEFFN